MAAPQFWLSYFTSVFYLTIILGKRWEVRGDEKMSTQEIISTLENGIRIIKFNKPTRKNAISQTMYKLLADILNSDANNNQVVVTIITGVGDYYSSGNDMKSAMETFSSNDEPTARKKLEETVRMLVTAFIDYPKLLIAVVNGPAIGIAATSAALCDIVYASDRATFSTPFIQVGLCCEACSSFTFPHILGRSKASEMLLLNRTLTAQEALQFGFVSEVVPHENLDNFINSLRKYSQLPVESVKINKRLITANYKSIMCECNERETEQLKHCIVSEEFSNALLKFMNKRSKL